MELNEIVKQFSDYYANHPCGIRLRKDQVGVEPIFDSDKSKGGLIIPDIAKGRCSQGIVKYLGPGVKDIQIGDYVIFSGYNGDLIAFEDELVIVMPEDFIQARITVLPEINNHGNMETYHQYIATATGQIGPLVDLRNKLESRVNEAK